MGTGTTATTEARGVRVAYKPLSDQTPRGRNDSGIMNEHSGTTMGPLHVRVPYFKTPQSKIKTLPMGTGSLKATT